MPEPYKRSRTLRRVKTKVPGGRTTTHYKRRKPSLGTCSVTGQTLKGVPRASPRKLQSLPKTKKRPSRPFGGVLSSQAMRDVMKTKST